MQHTSGTQGRKGNGHGQMHAAMTGQVSQDMQQCIRECMDCHTICRDTVTHCLEMGGEHAKADHIWMLLDCAEICQTSAHFMMHNFGLHHATCGACADICEACAQDCERMRDDREMQACAQACRRCAESCRKMAHA